MHAIEIAHIELQQNRRMVGGPASRCRLNTFKTKFGEIEQINERVDHANAIALVDPIIKAFRHQRRCPRAAPATKRFMIYPRQIASRT
jgi:hypothetical protein